MDYRINGTTGQLRTSSNLSAWEFYEYWVVGQAACRTNGTLFDYWTIGLSVYWVESGRVGSCQFSERIFYEKRIGIRREFATSVELLNRRVSGRLEYPLPDARIQILAH